jgi:hypothetical protein
MIKGSSLKETQPNLFELIVYQSLNEEWKIGQTKIIQLCRDLKLIDVENYFQVKIMPEMCLELVYFVRQLLSLW